MHKYTFEVTVAAVVSVSAASERDAREVFTAALGSLGTGEIKVADVADFVTDKDAVIKGITFSVDEDSATLVDADVSAFN